MTEVKKITQVLLVEDDPSVARLVQFKLEKNGFLVTIKDRGNEAILWLSSNRPSLILLDLMLPDISGYQVLEHVKGNPTLKDIPVIVLSSRGQKDEIDKCLALGAREHILKPFNPTELLDKIISILGE
ncbi:MAG TPA: response regulator [Candidatus Tripitaka californicus]|uniref:response regulator n=1 Tax=Candidatus Tripitaka californicus TaxID=3367616 RepID=UPI004026B4C3|nr:response regulator [Planctomycetota bacterium]